MTNAEQTAQPCEGGQWCRCPKSTPCYPPRTAAPADIRVKITTGDREWSAAHGETTADGAVVTVPAAAVERLTFAGCPMVRFDLRVIGKRIPRDWPNPWAQLPASHVVTD